MEGGIWIHKNVFFLLKNKEIIHSMKPESELFSRRGFI